MYSKSLSCLVARLCWPLLGPLVSGAGMATGMALLALEDSLEPDPFVVGQPESMWEGQAARWLIQESCLLQICPKLALPLPGPLWCGSSPLNVYDELEEESAERGNSAVKQETTVEAPSFFTRRAVLPFIPAHPSHHSNFIRVPPVRSCLLRSRPWRDHRG